MLQQSCPIRPRLDASFTDSQLRLEAIGNAFSVAEVAEQLAWIGAALRSSPHAAEAAYITAHVAEVTLENSSTPHNIHGRCRINFRMESAKDADLSTNGTCWRGMFRNPVIVRGYPILYRSLADTGLEMPLGMVSALTNCRRLVKFAGMTFIKGFAARLVAVRAVDDVIFWHLDYDPKGQYLSYEDHKGRAAISISGVCTGACNGCPGERPPYCRMERQCPELCRFVFILLHRPPSPLFFFQLY